MGPPGKISQLVTSGTHIPLFLLQIETNPQTAKGGNVPGGRCRLSIGKTLPLPLLGSLVERLLKEAQNQAADHSADSKGQQVLHRIRDDRDNPGATVRSGARATKEHRQTAGGRRSQDAGGQHAKRIGRGKGNGTLGDKRQTHDVVHQACLAIGLGPAILKERRGERDDQRRYHTARHDGSHDHIALQRLLGKGRGAKDICGLVDGTTHVGRLHAGSDNAQKNDARARKTVERAANGGVDNAHNWVNGHHKETRKENAQHGVDEHGLDTVERLG